MTFGFSLYAISLLVILVIYFRRVDNITGEQVYWKMKGVPLLTMEVSNSFSQFSV